MEQFFELPMSVYITQDKPIDGKRYLAASQTEQDAVVTEYRAFVGLQIYRTDTKTLWILEKLEPGQAVHANTVWVEVGKEATIDPSLISFLDLGDTPDIAPGYVGFANRVVMVNSTEDGLAFSTVDSSEIVLIADILDNLTSTATDKALSANMGRVLKLDIDTKEPLIGAKGTAFNQNFLTAEAADADETVAPNNSKAGIATDVARADHDHAGLYYKKSEVDSKVIGASQGIKGTWPVPQDMSDKIISDDAADGEMWILDANTPAAVPAIVVGVDVDVALENRAVYRWDDANSIWKFVYLMDADHNHDTLYEPKNTNIQSHISTVVGNPHEVMANEVQMSADIADSFSPTVTLGGYTPTDTVSNTNDVYAILKKLLQPIIEPILKSNVSVAIDFGATSVGSRYEIGTPFSTVFAAALGYKNYQPGKIENKDTPQTADTDLKGSVVTAPGDVTYSVITGAGATVDAGTGVVSGNVASITTTFRAAVHYNAGTALYYSNEGVSNIFDGQRNAGTVNGDGSVYGSYYLFHEDMDTAAPITSAAIKALNKEFHTKSLYSFTVPAGKKRVAIYMPPNVDPANVEVWLVDSNANVTVSPSTVNVFDGSGSTSVTYNLFDQYIGEGGYLVDKTYEIRIV